MTFADGVAIGIGVALGFTGVGLVVFVIRYLLGLL